MKRIYLLLFLLFLFVTCIIDVPTNNQEKPKYKGKLIITEVGAGYYVNDSRWIEVYNNSTETANLGEWTLRCKSVLKISPYTIYNEEVFTLPDLIIEPGCYALIRGKSYDYLVNSSNVVFISKKDKLPFWSNDGFIELKGTAGSDFVRFGTNNISPTNSNDWSGNNAPELPYSEDGYGKSIARDKFNTDTNNGSD